MLGLICHVLGRTGVRETVVEQHVQRGSWTVSSERTELDVHLLAMLVSIKRIFENSKQKKL